MHDNPRATDEEQELAQTERLHEEEAQRGPYPPAEESEEGDEADEDE
jgi:hypothetical protein